VTGDVGFWEEPERTTPKEWAGPVLASSDVKFVALIFISLHVQK
jgi:hypothetical protein